MIDSVDVRQALVVKRLTGRIVLARMDTGEIVSMSIPCMSPPPGSMLLIDMNGSGCPIYSVDGRICRTDCRCSNHAVIIEERDRDRNNPVLTECEGNRDVI